MTFSYKASLAIIASCIGATANALDSPDISVVANIPLVWGAAHHIPDLCDGEIVDPSVLVECIIANASPDGSTQSRFTVLRLEGRVDALRAYGEGLKETDATAALGNYPGLMLQASDDTGALVFEEPGTACTYAYCANGSVCVEKDRKPTCVPLMTPVLQKPTVDDCLVCGDLDQDVLDYFQQAMPQLPYAPQFLIGGVGEDFGPFPLLVQRRDPRLEAGAMPVPSGENGGGILLESYEYLSPRGYIVDARTGMIRPALP